MEAHGLKVFDVDELKSHGGSLRVYACRAEIKTHPVEPTVREGAGRRSQSWTRYGGRLR